MNRDQIAEVIWTTWVRETGADMPWVDAHLYAPEDAKCVEACADAILALDEDAHKRGYQEGWRDREADLIAGVNRIMPLDGWPDLRSAHKVMTREEYDALEFQGPHVVDHSVEPGATHLWHLPPPRQVKHESRPDHRRRPIAPTAEEG